MSLIEQAKLPLIIALILTFLGSMISGFLSPILSFLPMAVITFIGVLLTVLIGITAAGMLKLIPKMNLEKGIMWAAVIALAISAIKSIIDALIGSFLSGLGDIGAFIGTFIALFALFWLVMKLKK